MLPALEKVPRTPEDWNHFAWDHKDSHDRIRAGIARKLHVNLASYLIDPINPEAFDEFLQYNSQLHGDMNSVLGLPGSDLEDANLKDNNQLIAWIRLHFLEHFFAEQAAGA